MSPEQRPPHGHGQLPRWYVEGERMNRRVWTLIAWVGGIVALLTLVVSLLVSSGDDAGEPYGGPAATGVLEQG